MKNPYVSRLFSVYLGVMICVLCMHYTAFRFVMGTFEMFLENFDFMNERMNELQSNTNNG